MNDEYYLATFKTTHDALSFDKRFISKGYKTIIMPVPREISHSCGISVRLSNINLDKIIQIIDEEDISIEGIYLINGNKKKNNIVKIV